MAVDVHCTVCFDLTGQGALEEGKAEHSERERQPQQLTGEPVSGSSFQLQILKGCYVAQYVHD